MIYDPKDAVKHIVHDYVYLVAAGTDTQRGNPHPFNHYAERTFLVHCRALAEFFGRERDVDPDDFTVAPFRYTLRAWTHWEPHIQMHLMHLMAGRTKPSIKPWTGTANAELLKEFSNAWAAFIATLKDDLKRLFAQEIQKHKDGFKEHAAREYQF